MRLPIEPQPKGEEIGDGDQEAVQYELQQRVPVDGQGRRP
jgi:hypothetical protein